MRTAALEAAYGSVFPVFEQSLGRRNSEALTRSTQRP
jgi:hypothetical protein